MALSDNIRLLREHFNITQKELALIAKVSESAVSLWELGKSQPRMGAIQKIADHFGIKKSNIIEDGGMKEILHQPYNLNDIEHFSHIPAEQLTQSQQQALQAGYDFANNIGEHLYSAVNDRLTKELISVIFELTADQKKVILDLIKTMCINKDAQGGNNATDK